MARKRIKVKPSKGQSTFSFIVGIIFCGIGLFVVIPQFGPFGILWTLVAAFATFANFKNAFTEEGMLVSITRSGFCKETVGMYMGYEGGVYHTTAYFHNFLSYIAKRDFSEK